MIRSIDFRNKHFLALSGNIVISLISIVSMSILYRVLNKTDIGLWFFFLGIYGFTDAIRSGFLATAIVKFYAGIDQKLAKIILGSGWFIAFMITSIIVLLNLLAWLFSGVFSNPQSILIIQWIGLTFVSSMPSSFTFWILVADEKYLTILWLRSINSILMIGIILFMSLSDTMTIENLLLINFLTNCITSLICLLSGYSHIGTIIHCSKNKILELAHFGKFNLASTIGSNLMSSSSTFMITFFLGPAALAVYNLPQRLMEIIELPLRSFVGTGMSAMAAHMNKNEIENVKSVFKRFAGILTFAFIPIAIGGILFADIAIKILGGNKYDGSEAATIFRIMMVFSVIYPIDRFNGVTLDIIHQPKANFEKVFLMLAVQTIVGILGLYFLHNLYGMVISFPIALFAGIVFGYRQLNKYLPYKNRDIILIGWQEINIIFHTTIKRFRKA